MIQPSQNRPSAPAIFIPLGFIALSLILFTGVFGFHLTMKTGVLIHFLSYMALGLAFEVPELGLNIWCLRLSANRDAFQKRMVGIRKILRLRYILTHFIAPCSGITVMASGLFLVQKGGYSFQIGWLFWVMATATFGLYKGMYQHNLYVRRLRAFAESADSQGSIEMLRRALRSPLDQILIFLEFPTYAFNYAAAYYKFYLGNPLSGLIGSIDRTFGAEAAAGFLIITIGSLLLPILRFLIHRCSRTRLLLAP